MAPPGRLGMQSPGADKGLGGNAEKPCGPQGCCHPHPLSGARKENRYKHDLHGVKGISPGRKNAVTPPVQPWLRISTRPQQHRWLHPIPTLLSEFLFSCHYTHSIPPLSTRRLGGHTAVRRVLEQTTGHETGQRLRVP